MAPNTRYRCAHKFYTDDLVLNTQEKDVFFSPYLGNRAVGTLQLRAPTAAFLTPLPLLQ